MQKLVEEIIQIKKRALTDKIELKQIIIELGEVIDKFDDDENQADEEKAYYKSLLKIKSFKKFNSKNQKSKSKLKRLKILKLLGDFGFANISESQIALILDRKS